MDIDKYQNEARKSDQISVDAGNATLGETIVVPLLGIAGEIGSLQAAYKKKIRDGDHYKRFETDVSEELGDIMWYVSNLADKFDLKLSDILDKNIQKIREHWPIDNLDNRREEDLFDHEDPEEEKLPRIFNIEFRPVDNPDGSEPNIQAYWQGKEWGNALGDNSYMEDGYRFHDVFHLSHAAVLGWSPVARRNFDRKRKSDPSKDKVEDGGRAIVIEEGIIAFVYGQAHRETYFEGVDSIDWALLKTIQNMTVGLEVSRRYYWEWERAILLGYEVWNKLLKAGHGWVIGDLHSRTLQFKC